MALAFFVVPFFTTFFVFFGPAAFFAAFFPPLDPLVVLATGLDFLAGRCAFLAGEEAGAGAETFAAFAFF